MLLHEVKCIYQRILLNDSAVAAAIITSVAIVVTAVVETDVDDHVMAMVRRYRRAGDRRIATRAVPTVYVNTEGPLPNDPDSDAPVVVGAASPLWRSRVTCHRE